MDTKNKLDRKREKEITVKKTKKKTEKTKQVEKYCSGGKR